MELFVGNGETSKSTAGKFAPLLLVAVALKLACAPAVSEIAFVERERWKGAGG
jgi:hypothetical protein